LAFSDVAGVLQDVVHTLTTLDPAWVYTFVFLIAFIENLFPPSPSDVIIVFGGALVAMDRGNIVVALLAGTLGSGLGFMVMYSIGRWLGKKFVYSGKLKFIPLARIQAVDAWFDKYGYWLIVANRFLPGTRAIVSLFAGMAELDFTKTALLSFLSAFVWNCILVALGYSLGSNWEAVGGYLRTYSEVVTAIMLLAVAVLVLWRYILRKRRGL
jgi:membrane protein DedA with SNARE-associated domain